MLIELLILDEIQNANRKKNPGMSAFSICMLVLVVMPVGLGLLLALVG